MMKLNGKVNGEKGLALENKSEVALPTD